MIARRQLERLEFSSTAIERRLQAGRLLPVHRGVYAVGHSNLTQRGRWMAAILAHGDAAVLSHRSAAALWGLMRPRSPIDVTSPEGRVGRAGIAFHECRLHPDDLTVVDSIRATGVARTLFDLSEVVDRAALRGALEEADRLGLLQLHMLESVIDRGWGRHALKPIRPLVLKARHAPTTRSPLEDRFFAFCEDNALPAPTTNVLVLGHEVDALWPSARLAVELDSWGYHSHRAAFEGDRVRDAELLVGGYRIVRITHRRLDREQTAVLSQLRRLLGHVPELDRP